MFLILRLVFYSFQRQKVLFAHELAISIYDDQSIHSIEVFVHGFGNCAVSIFGRDLGR